MMRILHQQQVQQFEQKKLWMHLQRRCAIENVTSELADRNREVAGPKPFQKPP